VGVVLRLFAGQNTCSRARCSAQHIASTAQLGNIGDQLSHKTPPSSQQCIQRGKQEAYSCTRGVRQPDTAVFERERPPAGERGVQYQERAKVVLYEVPSLRMVADATIRHFLRNNADQDQDCTKEDEVTLWEMTRGVTCCRFGFSAVGFKARFSPGKRLQLKDRLPYFEPQPHPTTRGGYMPSIVATHYTEQSRVLLHINQSRSSARPSLSSQMQIFQGLRTCVKPTLTRPQSSKAECLILRHRRHAAIRCTAELTVSSSYTCTAAQ